MLKNYLICAYKVLLRRKLFTCISLFAVSLTLAILLLITTLIDNYLNPNGPEKHSDQFLTVNRLLITTDTGNATSSGGLGYRFYQDNITRLKTPQKTSLYTNTQIETIYFDDTSINSNLRYTDINYWEILDFEFVAGRGFDQHSFDTGAMQAVIRQSIATGFFAEQNPIGQSIEIGRQRYEVIGVVEDVSTIEMEAFSDIWVLYTTKPSNEYRDDLLDDFSALLFHSDPKKMIAMQQEYQQLISNDVILVNDSGYTIAKSSANNMLDKFVREINGSREAESGAEQVIFIAILLMLGFMLLPAINLINLNISRVIERTSEIGVRKAFGASSNQLVLQFLVENLVLTFIGGIIGFILAISILTIIESSHSLPLMQFSLSFNSLIYGFILIAVFSLLSGIYPAWKMSKYHPVKALKGSF